jgi:hypothetical protein
VRLVLRYRIALLVAALALCVLPAVSAPAADEAPGKLTDTWIFWVKAGHQDAFEAAVKAHLAWRKTAGEPFKWNAYQPVVGEDLTHYVFRSGPHQWKDFDDNLAWEQKTGAEQKYYEQMGQHVERAQHVIGEFDAENSSWTDSPDYKYFGVSNILFEPGTGEKRNAALATIHSVVVAEKWPYSYAIENVIGGRGGMTIASPYKSYADMADPETPFLKVAAKVLGSEGSARAVFHAFGSTIESETYTIYMARPDLSTPK